MGIGNIRFSFRVDRSGPEGLLRQVEQALRARLGPGQVPLRYAVVSVSRGRAAVEASVLDRRGLV